MSITYQGALSSYDRFVLKRYGTVATDLNETEVVKAIFDWMSDDGIFLRPATTTYASRYCRAPWRISKPGIPDQTMNTRSLSAEIRDYFIKKSNVKLGGRTGKLRFWAAIGEQVALRSGVIYNETEALKWVKSKKPVKVSDSPVSPLIRTEVYEVFKKDTGSEIPMNVFIRDFREACRELIKYDPLTFDSRVKINGETVRVFHGIDWRTASDIFTVSSLFVDKTKQP